MDKRTKMPARRITLAISLVLSLAVILGALLGVGGFATESVNIPDVAADTDSNGNAYLDVRAANVDYSEYMHLWYAVEYNLNDLGLDARDVKMAFWSEAQESYTIDSENIVYTADTAYKTTVTPTGGTKMKVVILHSDDIPAANMIDDIYARAYIVDGDSVYYSDVVKYSVVQYVHDRFEDAAEHPDKVTEKQLKLYEKTLNYGATAQNVLGYRTDRLANAAFNYVKLDGAYLADGSTSALLLPGEKITALAYSAKDGVPFYGYKDADGNDVSYNNVYEYTAPAIEIGDAEKPYASSTYSELTAAYSASVYVVYDDVNTTLTANGTTYQSPAELKVGDTFTITANATKTVNERTLDFLRWSDGNTAATLNVTLTEDFDGTVEYMPVYGMSADKSAEELAAIALTNNANKPIVIDEENTKFYINGSKQIPYYKLVPVNVNGTPAIGLNAYKTGTSGHGFRTLATNPEDEELGGVVAEFDICVNSSTDDATLMEWDLGSDYRLYLNSKDGKLNLSDYNKTYGNRYFDVEFNYGEWHNVRMEYHKGTLPAVDKDGYIDWGEGKTQQDYFYVVTYFDDVPVAVSSRNRNTIDSVFNTLYLYCYGSSGADLDYTVANMTMTFTEDVVTVAEALAENANAKICTLATIENQLADTVAALADHPEKEAILAALTELRDLYVHEDHEIWRWLANLYDPETGGFYYSNSARDTFGFLPDVESTGQAPGILNNLGVITGTSQLVHSDEAKAKLAAWILSLQSNEDGFIYHPQWGTNVTTSRRGRDANKLSYPKTFGGYENLLFDNYQQRATEDGIVGNANVVTFVAESESTEGAAYAIPTLTLRRSTVGVVSKVIALSANTVKIPAHLKDLDTFKVYLNNLFAKYATVDEAGNITKFNSYSFGHTISSQTGQINLNHELALYCLEFMNSKQEQIQEQLRDAAEAALLAENAAATAEEIAAARKNAENGLWELTNSYQAINGLLKISGAYNSLANGYKKYCEKNELVYAGEGKFNYPEQAIKSAVYAMLYDPDSTESAWKMSAVVNVYNPPNAINNVLSSLANYYSNSTPEEIAETDALREAMYAYISEYTLELITATTEKVEKFLKVDAAGNYSFSYSVDYSAATSQNEAAAVKNSAEGDVNGTGLAISTRAALLQMLQLPYVDITTVNYREDYYAILASKTESVEKTMTSDGYYTADVDTAYDFESGALPASGVVYSSGINGTDVVDVRDDGTGNSVVYLKDGETSAAGVNAKPVTKIAADGVEKHVFQFDSKLISRSGNGTLHQFFMYGNANTEGHFLKLDISYNGNGTITFGSRYFTGSSAEGNLSKETTETTTLKIADSSEWYNIRIEFYPDQFEVDGAKYYAKVTLTQGDDVQVANIVNPRYVAGLDAGFKNAYIMSLGSAKTEMYIDNVICETHVPVEDANSGVYNFDVPFATDEGAEIVKEEGKTNNNDVLEITASQQFAAVTLDGNTKNSYNTQVNYNFLEARIVLKDYAVGEVAKLAMLDSASNAIFYVTVTFEANGTLTFTDPNGNKVVEGVKIANIIGDEAEITVKLYYYADSERADLVVRYNDVSADKTLYPNGMSTAKAGSVTGVTADLIAGTSADYANAKISVNEGVVIYVDDVFVRNYVEEIPAE